MEALVSAPVLARDLVEDEALLKAAFVYNFAKFTRWPADAWDGPDSDLTLCTRGDGEVISSLDRLASETIRGRKVAIRRVAVEGAIYGCHILYLSGSNREDTGRWIAQTRAAPILAVSEIRGFADAGGVIQLYRAGDRIRFKVNRRAAEERRLTLSSRLLELAEVVEGAAP